MIFGESGGIERFQLAKRVLCASIAERERNVVGSKLLKLLIFIFFCRAQTNGRIRQIPYFCFPKIIKGRHWHPLSDMFDVLEQDLLDFVLAADDVDAGGWQLDIYCGGYVSAIDDCAGE